MRGSIRTNGSRLQAIAFKLSELHCVKYRRLPAAKLLSGASRLTSTLGGTDYFLAEIRNVVTTKQDMADPWGCDPHRINILEIDLCQAFVVGASAILPPPEQPSLEDGQGSVDAIMDPSPPNPKMVEESGLTETEKLPTLYHNLAVKQKAALVGAKEGAGDGRREFISHIETRLPHRHGPEAGTRDYSVRMKEVEHELDSFYGQRGDSLA
ncbi:hypothetical protein BGW39_003508 [Mortierella sp. 14UC]|nr:hypothetical protein BGW39_003508 [Mortierella sp. 14UC]